MHDGLLAGLYVLICLIVHIMRNLSAKIMTTLAVAIIMLHAFVPHHHHDFEEGAGIVFENELSCHCDCDHHDHQTCDHHHGGSHHPFDICLLQEMLSHLVLTTADDEQYFAALIQAEAQSFFNIARDDYDGGMFVPVFLVQEVRRASDVEPLRAAPVLGAVALRAPPMTA